MDNKFLLLLMKALMFVAELQTKAKVGASMMLLLWCNSGYCSLSPVELGA